MLYKWCVIFMTLLLNIQCTMIGLCDTITPVYNVVKFSLTSQKYRDIFHDNVAAAGFLKNGCVSVGFENRFFLKSLMSEELDAVFHHQHHTFTAQVTNFGDRRYGELQAGAGYVYRFGQHISVGLRAHYLLTYTAEYQSIHSFTFDAAIYARVGRNVGLGFSVYNPARLKYGVVGKMCLPVEIHFNFDYLVGNHLLLFLQTDWEHKTRLLFTIGAKYQIRMLTLTTAASIPNPGGTISVDLCYQRFQFGVTCQYLHPLGFVPRASITFIL